MRHFFTLLLAFGVLGFASAQDARTRGSQASGAPQTTNTVTGTVVDEKGAPLPGASVTLLDATGKRIGGGYTNAAGVYSFASAQGAASIRVSFVSYADATFPIGSIPATIAMKIQDVEGEEVVVTAQGISQKRKELPYATAGITGGEVLASREVNVVQGLAGKLPGVQIAGSGGLPGQSARIQIRGYRSLTGNDQPLFIIDGVPVQNGGGANPEGPNTDAATTSNRLIDLNPDDIESFNVLPGQAAAARYGQFAANGAVVITTKRGRAGKMRVDVSQTVLWEEANRLPDFQSEWSQGVATPASGGNTAILAAGSTSWGPRISELGTSIRARMGTNAAGALVISAPYTNQVYDNVGTFLRTALNSTTSVGFSGGNDAITYRFSASYADQESIVPNQGFQRLTMNGNAQMRLSDKWSSSFSIQYANSGGSLPTTTNSGLNPFFALYHVPRNRDLAGMGYFNADGSQRNFRGGSFDNPYWAVNENTISDFTDRFLVIGTLDYDVLDWVRITGRASLDNSANRYFQVIGRDEQIVAGATKKLGTITSSFGSTQLINTDFLVTANRTFNDFRVNAVLGHNLRVDRAKSLTQSASDIRVKGLPNLSAAASVQTPAQGESEARIVGAFATVNVGWRDQVFVELTGRNDWNSTLPKENRSFFYYSAGASWLFGETFKITQEDGTLSFGKFRLAYAEVGAGTGPYLTSQRFAPSAAFTGYESDAGGIVFPFDGRAGFSVNNTLGNGTLRPELTKSIEFGLELGFLGGRIRTEMTYYNTRTVDQIVPITPSLASGFAAALVNAGEMQTNGFDISLNADIIREGDIKVSVNANWYTVTSKAASVHPVVKQIFLGGFSDGAQVVAQEGLEYPHLFGVDYLRDGQGRAIIDPTSGLPTFLTPRPVALGSIQPDWLGGFGSTISYKNLIEFSFLFDFRVGGKRFSGTEGLLDFYGMSARTAENGRADRVFEGVLAVSDVDPTATGTVNTISVPASLYWQLPNLVGVDGPFIYDVDVVRLRQLNLTFNLPNEWIAKTPFKRASITLTGRNLWFWSNYPHLDPESNLFGNSKAQGYDRMNVPNTRSYGFAVNLTF